MTQSLGVAALAPAALHVDGLGHAQRRAGDHIGDGLAPPWLYPEVIHQEHLASVPPQGIERVLRPPMALFCSVAELEHPVAGVTHVIARLFRGLRRDPGEV